MVLVLSSGGCRLTPSASESVQASSPILAVDGIIEASGVSGGLVAVVGCRTPSLLADLSGAGSYLVHGLDRDPAAVAAARRYLQEKKLYGTATVSTLQDTQLPFVDSTVNLLVITDSTVIPKAEIMRVLSPKGVLADATGPSLVTTVKDRPRELDEWTHYLYDASNNAVSNDTIVDLPRGLRWKAGPVYARSHENFASLSAMVTAGGRIFTIIDVGPISSVFLPPQWKLVARDAFSGVPLWERPIENWESQLRGFRSGPAEIGRRLVATENRVYVALNYGDPVSVLDASTGGMLSTLAGTEGARELLLTGGILYVLSDDMTADQHRDRKEWIEQTYSTIDIWYQFPRVPIPMYGVQRIVAVNVDTGELVWENRAFTSQGEIMPATMAAGDDRACVQTVSHVVCLEAADGQELWRTPRPVATSRFSWSTPTLVIQDGVVVTVDRLATDNVDTSPPPEGSKWVIISYGKDTNTRKQPGEIVTFSLDDGRELWRAPCFENYTTPLDIFVMDGVVWVGALRHGSSKGFTQGRDIRTGEVIRELPPQHIGGHHRCYRNRATVRWMLLGRGGIDFLDPVTGDVKSHYWVRGGCQYGVMPANGLVYVPQHSCACNTEELLVGFNVLSPTSSAGPGSPPLERGPAHGEVSLAGTVLSTTDWPTYRRDARRSGYQGLPVPAKPNVTWATRFDPPITAPVIAAGMAVIAETNRHTIHAVSAADGTPVWTFVADGRIDSPPTLYGGLCLFGTRNGFVYCLRASDGKLVWRFRGAQQDRRLFAYGQLESVWPIHGSLLVDDTLSAGVPVAYFAAGRSSRIDGGIRLFALDPATGEMRHTADVDMNAAADAEGAIRQRVMPDILSAQRDAIWMRHVGVDGRLVPVKQQDHLYAPRGFLDDTWWHRTYWIHGTAVQSNYGGWPVAANAVPSGRLLSSDDGGLIYGYGRSTYRPGGGHVRPDALKDYRLFAETLDPKPQAAKWQDRKRRIKWTTALPFIARSLVLTPDALLVAGGEYPDERADHHGPGTLWVASREDGSMRSACELPAPPVLDGMALTDGGIFVSAIDGSLLRLSD